MKTQIQKNRKNDAKAEVEINVTQFFGVKNISYQGETSYIKLVLGIIEISVYILTIRFKKIIIQC